MALMPLFGRGSIFHFLFTDWNLEFLLHALNVGFGLSLLLCNFELCILLTNLNCGILCSFQFALWIGKLISTYDIALCLKPFQRIKQFVGETLYICLLLSL